MKRVVEFIFILVFASTFGQNDQAFLEANALYNKQKFQEAVDSYKAILDTDQESASLYYNLANAHYKLSNVSTSIYYYEKALQLAPNDEDVKNNLAFAQKATIDAIDVIPQGIISKTVQKFMNLFTIDGWARFSIIFIILFVILFILYYIARISFNKRIFFITSWVALFIAILGVFFSFKQYNVTKNNQFAIIFAQQTAIKSEPNLRSNEVFQLHEGTKVQVTETVNDWKKIKLADGKIGWLPATDLKEL